MKQHLYTGTYRVHPGDWIKDNNGKEWYYVSLINDVLIVKADEADKGQYSLHVSRFPDFKIKEDVDITPTWRGMVPLLIIALTQGTDTGKKLATEEMYRLADIADGKK